MAALTTRTPDRPFELVGSTLPGWPDPGTAIAASRAGATGLLNLEHTADPELARTALARLVAFGRGALGVKLEPGARAADAIGADLPSEVGLLVLTGAEARVLGPTIDRMRASGRRVFVECRSVEEARAAIASGADGLVAKGCEAGGRVGDETTFVLVQRLAAEIDRPLLAFGGIGLHTAPACYVAGCHGVVLDVQLALARESSLPARLRAALERMEGDETVCLGTDLGEAYRVYQRPGTSAVESLRELEASFQDGGESDRARWRTALEERLGWDDPETQAWPLGQDAAFAAPLARRFRTVAGILGGLRSAVAGHVELARVQRALDRGGPLARAHGTEHPILQGPMTRVSDTPDFALAVARGGALPFLALALLRGPRVRSLLVETRERMGELPWGVGILGFVPLEVRQEQLEAIREIRPRFAIIAGGRPDQAALLESNGVATYLHVPAPGLLRVFLESGARRFVFEGRECGGHVGPRTSFVLWQAAIDTLLDAVDAGVPPRELHVVFAGGIHDERSAAMVAAMAAPLVARGARIGVLLGTAYLFTEEAVEAGAIVEGFQAEALHGTRTVLLESGPGHTTRCLQTPFHDTFRHARRRLVAEGRSPEEVRGELEALNLGRLRIASKGLVRESSEGDGGPRYVTVAPERQRQDGLYMIGQVAALRSRVCRIAELHDGVSAGSAALLDALPPPPLPAGRAPVEPARPVDVAIIGLGCLLPKAPDVAAFWANVLGGVDAITEVPRERFDVDLYFDPDRKARDKVYSRWGGFLEDVPFDPLRYGIPPAALPSIDALQLLSLEVVRQALADAGYLDRDFPRERTAVILGLSGGLGDLGLLYGVRSNLPALLGGAAPEILERLPTWTEDSFAGILLNVAAGRVANRFDLGGVNYTVDAACASSLAAVYLAASELQSGTSDMVVVGGVDTVQSPFGFLCFSTSQALSPRGRCRTFDASADGIAISEGLTMLVLKRLADAERDGDRIYAVIKAVAGSSDGRGKSLTAPRPEGQTQALVRAYARAGISPATVGLIEAHGTGTVVGDAAEVEALSEVFATGGALPASCAIGSVKSMIGHTKSAAGVTGLMKVALSLHHKVLPPTLHVETPNPRLQEETSPFFVSGEPLPWIPARPGTPRRGGVSSFGFGGTNFHAVVEEYEGDFRDPLTHRGADAWPAELLVWHSSHPEALGASLASLQARLEEGARPRLRDLAASVDRAATSRPPAADAWRLAIVATSLEDLRGKLGIVREALRSGCERLGDPKGVFLGHGSAAVGTLAFLFPGQGSQAPFMLRDLAVHFPHIRRVCEEADRVLGARLSGYIYPPPAFTEAGREARMAAITDTAVAQPALGTVEIGLLRLLRDLGLDPDMVAGHSYGEYVALAAAEVFSERALLEISEARGRAIKDSVGDHPGVMAAVLAPVDAVASVVEGRSDVWIANVNAPEQTIVAGTPRGVETALSALTAAGLRARPLPVACAFHTPLMERARERLAHELARRELRAPRIPVFSNTEASPYPDDPARVREVLSEHLVRPVRFLDEVRAMHERGARLFLEVGPKSVLTGLVRRILDGEPEVVALSVDAPEGHGLVRLLHVIAQLSAAGVGLRLGPLFEGRDVVPVALERLGDELREPAWVVTGAGARSVRPAPRPLETPERPASVAERRVSPSPAPVRFPVVASSEPTAAPPSGNRSDPPTAFSALSPLPADGVGSRVNGGTATAPDATGAVPAAARVGGGSAPTASGVTAAVPADAVLLQFQSLMSQFLQTQAAVMTAYLQGGGGDQPFPSALPAPAPSSPVTREVSPPTPETPPTSSQKAPAPTALTATLASPVAERDAEVELLRLVAERTGYPEDMLRPDAKIEADLGIDSIKRVEILSAFQRRCSPEEQTRIQGVMERLTRHGTLREMSTSLAEALRGAEAPSPPARPDASEPGSRPRNVASELLRLVAERTGYPEDMLRSDASIEADLGIDSIKRVEILSAFQRRCSPEEQGRVQAAMEHLTRGRTLRDVTAALEEALSTRSTESRSNGDGKGHEEPARPLRTRPEGTLAEEVPRLTLTAVPAPTGSGRSAPHPGRVWLVTDDEDGLAEQVVGRLVERGERPVLLRHRPAATDAATEPYAADLTRPEQVAAVLEAVRRHHGAPSAVLHLLPLKQRADFDALSMDAWRACVQADIKTLYGLLHTAEADLSGSGRAGGAMVVAATSLGASTRGASRGAPPTHAGVAALLKTAATEMPDVACRAVHLEPSQSAEEKLAQLLAELASPEGPVEVVYTGGRRLTFAPRLAPLPAGANGVEIGPDWVFLVTGGARGITAEIAAHVASAHQPTLVLAGLTPLPAEEPADTAAIAEPAALKTALTTTLLASHPDLRPADVEAAWRQLLRDREIRRTLDGLRKSGARVEYHAVDVRDEVAFGALIDGIYRTHGRLDAVIHGAGIIEDKLLKDKTSDSFDRVVHTKTDSAFTLARHLRPDGLKLLVFMSSVTATFGNRGQADYGAANGVLNALAGRLAARWPARVRALNWGPWDRTGMVTEAVKRQFASRGIQVIPAPAGVAAAAREMQAESAAEPVVVFGGGPWVAEALTSPTAEREA